MRRFCVILLFVFLYQAQTVAQDLISGQVLSDSTGEPVPYVNVGILETDRGTVSDEKGKFKLESTGEGEVLFVSAIGFEDVRIPLNQIDGFQTIRMSPRAYSMDEVNITSRRLGDLKEIGYKPRLRRGHTGFANGEPGDEIAAWIKIDRPVLIKEANFVILETAGDSMKYRINIYPFDGERSGANLLKKNYFLEGEQNEGTHTIDLSEEDLVLNGDVLLTLEFIDTDVSESGKDGVLFRYNPARTGNFYSRYVTGSKSTNSPFSKNISANLNFYLTGHPLD